MIDLLVFADPAFGTEGNEKTFQFRNPMFFQTDGSLAKDTPITERVKLGLRFDFFHLYNRANLYKVDGNQADSTFGKALSQYTPRWIQLGANVTF